MRKKIKKILGVALIIILISTKYCFAGITDSSLIIGTQNLITDLTNWLLIIAPTVTILLIGYYLLRKSASDEMDGKRWDSRIKVAIICCVGVVVMSGLINVLMSYYR